MSSEVLQKLDLPQRALGQDLLAEDIGDLLDRNTFIGLSVCRGTEGRRVSVHHEWMEYVVKYQTIP
jgi:hypothetical protein